MPGYSIWDDTEHPHSVELRIAKANNAREVMEITQQPQLHADPPTKSDWFAWLKTDDGLHIMLQIDYHASEERAREIVYQLASIGEV